MQRFSFLFFTLFLCWFCAHSVYAEKVINIAFLDDGPKVRHNVDIEVIKKEINSLLSKEYKVQFNMDNLVSGNWDEKKIRTISEHALSDSSIDIIVALGILNAHYFGNRGNLSKPVIAPIVVDPALQGIKMVNGKSGVENFTYLAKSTDPEEIFNAFRKISPIKRIAILGEGRVLQSIPELSKILERLQLSTGIQSKLISASGGPEAALGRIDASFDSVILAPLPSYSLEQIRLLAEGLLQRQLPSFTLNGREEVEQGLLAGYESELDEQRIARRIALNIQRILLGESASSIPVIFDFSEKIVLNQSAAYVLDRFPPFEELDQYDIINRDDYRIIPARKLSLQQAVSEAMQRNLDIIATIHQTNASSEKLKTFRANLLPSLDLAGSYRKIDKKSVNNFNAERESNAQLQLNQVIYSDEAIGIYYSQKYLHLSQEQALQQVRLDAVLNAATAYLNLLQAKQIAGLQADNLERARQNLELAEVRRRIGASSAGEVYRWESEIASSRSAYASARAQVNQLTVAFLQLINRPQNEQLDLQPVSLTTVGFFFNDTRFDRYASSPWSFRTFHEFMVDEAMNQSPEIQQVIAQLDAQKRNLTTAKRKRWAPLVTAGASTTEILDTTGPMDDRSWQYGVNVSVPLYAGGGNKAAVAEAEEQLTALQIQLKSLRNQIEQQVRNQLLAAEASYPTMQYSADAANAAEKNLELITDAYKRGTVSIIELIDAQNSALNADIQAVNAVYDFIIDYFTLERVVGRFDILSDASDKEAWFKRMDDFFRTQRASK